MSLSMATRLLFLFVWEREPVKNRYNGGRHSDSEWQMTEKSPDQTQSQIQVIGHKSQATGDALNAL